MADPPKSPTLRRKYDSRQREVLDACARAFAERGYHGTSIDDLIEATGLARGGLYHYIGSKSEALTRILDDLMGPLLEAATAAVEGPDAPASAAGRLRAMTRIWMHQVETHRAHVAVFEQERRTLERDPAWSAVRDDRRAFEALLLRVLRDGVRTGEFTIPDPDLTALALLGMVNHSALWFAPDGRLDAEQVADGFVDLLLRGVRNS
ncbi:TetR/AcrR family transcriptional regulator [Patulibacter minatonensis]|uniref:TetR/AcrR family transcriptional regulator n=1 Tax=Patulibacter minatonensis TaxID=298163 RepID=UPI00047E400F|nr:TetR/AcrR family transcriptional regulator [Patulibacter minatonensis]